LNPRLRSGQAFLACFFDYTSDLFSGASLLNPEEVFDNLIRRRRINLFSYRKPNSQFDDAWEILFI
jgi:hypothetical protein